MLPESYAPNGELRPVTFIEYAKDIFNIDIEEKEFHYESYPKDTPRAQMAADLFNKYGGNWSWDASMIYRDMIPRAYYSDLMSWIGTTFRYVTRRGIPAGYEYLQRGITDGFQNIYRIRVQTSEEHFLKGYGDRVKVEFATSGTVVKPNHGVFKDYQSVDVRRNRSKEQVSLCALAPPPLSLFLAFPIHWPPEQVKP